MNKREQKIMDELFEACMQSLFAIPTTHGAFQTVRNAIAKAHKAVGR